MIAQKYTHKPIKGIKYKYMLPEGVSLVLEGGGTRGFYTAGVFEAFMDEGIMFPYIIGVSAGAANAISYISGQPMRNRQVVENYVADPRYVSKRNLIFHRSMFNMDFIFRTIPQKHIAIDWEMFDSCDTRFLTGAMDCETGNTVWFEKDEVGSGFEAVIASCSVPVISPMVKYKGLTLLDGGVTSPIPVDRSIADGNTFHVIVLTRNAGYRKSEFRYKKLLKFIYGKYPRLVEAVLRRHEVYNRQLELCEELEKEGKAIIIRPQEPLQVERTGSDTKKLLALYDEGHREGAKSLGILKEYYGSNR